MFTDYPTRAGGQRIGQLASGVNHADHLLRLYADVDGIYGLAWAIPLGSSVSVGISMPHGQEAPDADDVLSHVEAAYRRRGLDLRAVVDNPRPPVDIPHQQYFIHDRAYGRNWLLTGPTYGQFWFPSASGVGSALVAAQLAAQIVQGQPRAARTYEAYVDGLRGTHLAFESVISRECDDLTKEAMETTLARIIAENVIRVGPWRPFETVR